MESWLRISILLCIFGLLKEFRPSEPYVTKYLNNPPMNFTLEQISDDIYPTGTYTSVISLVLIFLLTDFLRYKPVIILGALSAVLAYVILIFGRGLFWAQVLEVFYGLFMACDVAYYAYIYAKVSKTHYQEVSGHTRTAYLIGRTIQGLFSQIYVFMFPTDYYTLNFFTLAGMVSATIWAFLLPPVNFSIYFNRYESNQSPSNLDIEVEYDGMTENSFQRKNFSAKCRRCVKYLVHDFYAAMSNFYTVQWIIWWALATAGYYQILNYVQVLWEQILQESNAPSSVKDGNWNGAVEMIYTLLSAGTSFTCGIIKLEWSHYGELAMFLCSIAIAGLLFLMARTTQIILAYATYILYAMIYNGMITIANSEIAQNVNEDSHGLIFGFTTFIALIIQSVLTLVVTSDLNLDERTKFIIYCGFFTVLGVLFAIITVLKALRSLLSKIPNE